MKYRPIFISATNTDIGKTYTTIKLIEELGKRGLKVGVLKPIETGVEEYPLDGRLLLQAVQKTNPALKEFTCKDIVPIQYKLPASPYVSKAGEKIDYASIHAAFENIAQVSDIVVIEGAGGLMVPVDEKLYMYDLIKEFNAITLLVTHANLGCINDTLLNINLLESLDVKYTWCINFRENEEDFIKTTLPFYEYKFGKVLSVQKNICEILDSLVMNRD
ncbi:dethiobiotin synthase [Sulfurospirillum arcachonense]|uniref:dethiobiotin synthase n=1 Tax=Sulfurospirillum arcachonense TaxID=57666 RepID=UPI000468F17F|nr:dethiobiotin synthase [Sulfurospirillum arcachonense]